MADEKSDKAQPEESIRAGAVKGTIWRNTAKRDGKDVQYRTFVTTRSYSDKNNEWQETQSMRVNDLPKLVYVLNKMYAYALENPIKE